MDAIDGDAVRAADQHREACDVAEVDAFHIQTANALRQYPVSACEPSEGLVVRGQSRADLDRLAIAVDREIAQPHTITVHHDDRASREPGRHSQHRPRGSTHHLRAPLNRHLRVHIDDPRRKLYDMMGRRHHQANRDRKQEDGQDSVGHALACQDHATPPQSPRARKLACQAQSAPHAPPAPRSRAETH